MLTPGMSCPCGNKCVIRNEEYGEGLEGVTVGCTTETAPQRSRVGTNPPTGYFCACYFIGFAHAILFELTMDMYYYLYSNYYKAYSEALQKTGLHFLVPLLLHHDRHCTATGTAPNRHCTTTATAPPQPLHHSRHSTTAVTALQQDGGCKVVETAL